jgi:probable rRNA maturation factor
VSVSIGVAAEGTRIPIARDRVASVARAVLKSERVADALLSITFVSNAGIRALNRKHFRRARLTDVISFGFRKTGRDAPVVGDVYIASDVARASARANGVGVREEIVRLIVHGTLHVLGYDHPETQTRTRSAMWRKQERLVKRLASKAA